MARAKDFHKGTKKFLNTRNDELGLISWSVTREAEWREERSEKWGLWINADLTLGDCSRTVRLDMDVDMDVPKNARSSLHNRLKKLDTLIDELHELRAALIQASELE